MSKYFIEDTTLTAIGDAIRLKRDTVDEINPEDMPMEIGLIGGGGGLEYTAVTSIPGGRSFSINTDYDRCVIVLRLVTETNWNGGMGYNGAVKNIGSIQWTTDGTGWTAIMIDNVNLRMQSIGLYKAGEGTRQSGGVALTERARNIQPHWVNSTTAVTGGYWTIPINV